MIKRLALTLCFSALCPPSFAGVPSHKAVYVGSPLAVAKAIEEAAK
jgi:hypothetical protein